MNPSPLRRSLDHLLETLAAAAIDSQGPMGAAWIRLMMRRRGWDSRVLCSRGPLRGVSDATLLKLLIDLADEIDRILVEHGGDVAPATRDRALAELSAALAGG